MRRIVLGAVAACIGSMVIPAGPVHAVATCGGRAVTIAGTANGETIRGTERDDVIDARAGNDVVISLGGNDIVCGGAGADYVLGYAGADRLDGGLGDDVLVGDAGDDTVTGADGDDTMLAGGAYDGVDTFHGSAGFDRVDYSSRTAGLTVRLSDNGTDPGDEDAIGVDVEWIVGSQGNDTLVVATAAGNRVEGGTGDDTIDASDGVPGNDLVVGNYGIDQCRADDSDIIQSCP